MVIANFIIGRTVLFKLRSKTAQSRANLMEGTRMNWAHSSRRCSPGLPFLRSQTSAVGKGPLQNIEKSPVTKLGCDRCCAVSQPAATGDAGAHSAPQCVRGVQNKRKFSDPRLIPKTFPIAEFEGLPSRLYFLRRKLNFMFRR